MTEIFKTGSADKQARYDVVIIGGGMVGSALAIGLAQCDIKVALIESSPPTQYTPEQPPDLRVSAINLATQTLLKSLHAWEHISTMRHHPYKRLAVWEDTGKCEFRAEEVDQPLLGYFIENRLIQLGLHQRAATFNNLDLLTDQSITNVSYSTPTFVEFDNEKRLYCDWIVAADGVQSSTRQHAQIETRGWPYSQQVLAITIHAPHAESDITWQQFSPTGPMAFLPLFDNHAELIWYHTPERITELKNLTKDQLKKEICRYFPQELGDIEVIDCASFPIQRLHATQYSQDNLLLIGDAAHSINPLAGQGVNLGFKDVSAMIDLIKKNGYPSNGQGIQRLFKQYERERRADNLLMMSTMDALYVSFSNNVPSLRHIRNLGMSVANKLPFVKKKVLRYAAGANAASP